MSTGRYQVFAELACGGMAMVYLGQLEGEHGFKRSLAIKKMHAQYARDPEFRGMFLDEARLVARIRHPNVVPTLDIVSREDALLLVMDYIDGESALYLTNEAGRIPPRIAAAIAQDALMGLHAAHELADEDGRPLGVIHRDVSPANVLVGTDGLARILDFGVAKAAGRSAPTRDGSIKGKVAYMPPEQLWGGEIDRTVDVYAMSVVLWEMLTGQNLFRGNTDVESMSRVVEQIVEPPSKYALDAGPLDEVVLKGLSRDPSKRFATALEMAKAIDRALTPASRLEIGDWVSEVAADSLAERGELLRRMQRGERAPGSYELAAVATALLPPPQAGTPFRAAGAGAGASQTVSSDPNGWSLLSSDPNGWPITGSGVAMTRPGAPPRLDGPSRGRLFGSAAAALAAVIAVSATFLTRSAADHPATAAAAALAPEAAKTSPTPLAPVTKAAEAPTPPPPAVSASSDGAPAPAPAPSGKKSKPAPAAKPSTHAPVVSSPAPRPSEPPPGAVPAAVPGPALGSRY
jgi:serine/threonine-protein kinase